ncbi:zinc finger CCCH domain-containing protein 11A isoform X1 [Synchiropus splendidus]|uniref:zinc finger CCCH domain-containing protein 11A isoform X1 n=1 Tax=Synchiropus splendidus TaxID=270530 RepID=UPI00237E63E1|nr:zinc finger CCCH domain-containing protein 11A isoform X1 [Synchiropus splendidus]XP_053725360.1 zinc finger CCCH domain-containing protein 11A isoform X1 [Synchiropus splendidus]XP_053725361.1 zinc finger CCCH domain-containing protein 11A isoform X1 [Synchiropus splendidus]
MTNHGDDCYFYYYSTCTKGDKCPFRHCEAAMGNEIVCNLWQEGRCFRAVCKFRHMEITKNRKDIPCYWETHPTGCQKPHCAFFHEKPRCIEGMFVPPDKKGVVKVGEPPQEEPPAQPQATPLPAAAIPQLRGVKTESQDPVQSPTHPPVVINPAEDDEDEDDQCSEEGEDGKCVPSARKMSKLDNPLNFGVSTLEEIRLRKTLRSNMMMREHPAQRTVNKVNVEKENIQSLFRASAHGKIKDECFSFDGTEAPKGSVLDRLGRRLPHANLDGGEGVAVRSSLADRLGKVVSVDEAPSPLQPGSTSRGAKVEDIRIKTLDEIKKEKAAKNHKDHTSKSLPSKGVKRAISVKGHSIGHVKTFSEIIQAKKKKREEQELGSSKPAEKASCKTPEKLDVALAERGEVRVKTLEEIRREKAARIQARQLQEEESDAKKPRLLSTKATAVKSGVKAEACVERGTPRTASAAPQVAPAPGTDVKVKTFEEIMREKSLRRQEQAEQGSEPKPVVGGSVRRKLPSSVSGPPAAVMEAGDDAAVVEARHASETQRPPQAKLDVKVRPKLNVKPSVMKPAVRVRPGAKRKAAEHSAVAAVKPLSSSSSAAQEEEASLSPPGPAVLHCTSPLREAAPAASGVTSAPEEEAASSTVKSPAQAKARRQSMSTARSSAAASDDFEDLINEFADGDYEEDVDPGIGEDDLLQELSDMIDS